jgi:hypothetical protein
MDWRWALLMIAVSVAGLFVCRLTMSAVDEDHCPYKVGTDRAEDDVFTDLRGGGFGSIRTSGQERLMRPGRYSAHQFT